jgi:endonuclease/exonuclease/phosphatase family metal-dependent hydrolase
LFSNNIVAAVAAAAAAGEEARSKSAALLVSKLSDLSAGSPVVVVGDLNAGEGTAVATASAADLVAVHN